MESEIAFALDGNHRPHVIALGSEKGGTGKSTTAMHLAVVLTKMGFSVGSIDFDYRQGTLSRYLANRAARAEAMGRPLAGPLHRRVGRNDTAMGPAATASESAWARGAFDDLRQCDYIILDTPGNDTHLARVAHLNADTLITPINDSLLDIDIIAQLDTVNREALGPGVYTQMVWEQNSRRVNAGLPAIDWIVMRNRLSHIGSRNQLEITSLLELLAERIGFRLAPGFGERVVFREMFLEGLTLLDLDLSELNDRRAPSRSAARRELGELLQTIGITAPRRRATPPASAA
jgi:chromosome partitioning protein